MNTSMHSKQDIVKPARGKLISIFCGAVKWIFAALWIFAAICLLCNFTQYKRFVTFHLAVVIAVLLVLTLFLGTIYFVVGYHANIKTFLYCYTNLLMWAGVGLLFVIQVLFARYVYTPIGWDVQAVIEGVEWNYMLTYPNNIFLAFLFRTSARFFNMVGVSDLWLASMILNILFVDFSIITTTFCCKKLYSWKTCWICFGLLMLTIGISPYITVPYSDTMALPFPALAFYLFLLVRDSSRLWKKVLLCFLMGITAVVGMMIKPTVIIVFIAMLIWWMLKSKTITLQRIKTAVLCMTALCIGMGCLIPIDRIAHRVILKEQNTSQLLYHHSFPLTHFMMMGLKDHDGYFGGYNYEDVAATDSIAGKKEKMQYHLKEIAYRVKEYGAFGLISHLGNKLIWVTTDGTFLYGGEGNFHQGIPKNTSGIRGVLQNYTYTETPFFQHAVGNIEQALWLFLLLGLIGGVLGSAGVVQRRMEMVLRLSILGLILFLLLFEARSRYLILYLPYFVLLASNGWDHIFSKIRGFVQPKKSI